MLEPRKDKRAAELFRLPARRRANCSTSAGASPKGAGIRRTGTRVTISEGGCLVPNGLPPSPPCSSPRGHAGRSEGNTGSTRSIPRRRLPPKALCHALRVLLVAALTLFVSRPLSAQMQRYEQPTPEADRHEVSVLLYACGTDDHERLGAYLSGRPELANARDKDGIPVLAHATSIETAEVLLQNGANPRSLLPDGTGVTSRLKHLHSKEFAKLVKAHDLIDILRTRTLGHAHPVTRREESFDQLRDLSHELLRTHPHMSCLIDPWSGSGVLDFAIQADDIALMRLALAAGCEPDAPNAAGIVPIDTCAEYRRADLYRALVDEFRVTPTLFAATACGTDDESLAALELPVKKESQADRPRRAPIHNAAQRGLSRTLRRMIQRGADANAADPKGNTPLHYAAGSGIANNVRLLLKAGADPGATNREGMTALMMAASTNVDIDTLSLLLDAAPDTVNARSIEGSSAMDLINPPSEELYMLLLDRGADPNTNPMREPPIAKAAEHGYVRAVKRMIKAGANLNPDPEGRSETALHAAVRGGHTEIASMLIEAGADVNANNGERWRAQTPLGLAIARDDPVLTHMLLTAGAGHLPIWKYDTTRSPNALAVLRSFIGDD